jgi:hypothetical protein
MHKDFRFSKHFFINFCRNKYIRYLHPVFKNLTTHIKFSKPVMSAHMQIIYLNRIITE